MALSIASLILMTLDHRTDMLQEVRSALMIVAYPIQYMAALPVVLGEVTSDKLALRSEMSEDNRRLRHQLLLADADLQKLAALKQENVRLRSLLASAEQFRDDRVLVAELLAVDLDPYRQSVVINKGEIDGVYLGQPLLDAAGVMGQITEVDVFHSTALLISDPGHALPVQVNRNGIRTLAVGTGNPQMLNLLHIPNNSDIREGDVVNTSGLGGRFPADYPVATVTEVAHLPGEPFAKVTAEPLAQLDRSREVLLVWWKSPAEEPPPPEFPVEPTASSDISTEPPRGSD